MKKTVIELFAGVGGFRVGLNNVALKDNKVFENKTFNFIWMNQWEPSTRSQHAFDCYVTRFGAQNIDGNVDISTVKKSSLPKHTLLCGGFPCQDYSVARTLSKEKGIKGKKGVLWWEIRDIIEAKKPPFVFLENVDRLLKSPSKQRGRDFGIMLRCFADLGYCVEWRVINAADYGAPQRRRRVFIFAYKNTTVFDKSLNKYQPKEIIDTFGAFATTFKIEKIEGIRKIDLLKQFKNLVSLSNSFKFKFENAGLMRKGIVYTAKAISIKDQTITLNSIVQTNVPKEYYLTKQQIKKFAFLRGSKKIPRKTKDGKIYYYSEGSMAPYDYLNLPGRTMLTSEGSVNRTTHIVKDKKTKKLRFLTPIECERLNQFPDNWTNTGMPKRRRYFMMGNALVCGIIKKFGKTISKIIDKEK